MSFGIWSRTIRNSNGEVLPGAEVEVREVQDTADADAAPITLATIYEDFDGNTVSANPFTVGEDGDATFYADGNHYHVVVTFDGIRTDKLNQQVGLAQARDIALSPTSGNLPEFGAKGDLIDSGKASTDVGSGGGVDAEDGGSVVVSDASAFNFGTNLSVSDDGDGTVTITASSGGTDVTLDLGDDGSNESTALSELATTNDSNSIFTEPSADKLLIDVGKSWPQADVATALQAGAVDDIGEIDAILRTGADTTLVTGTAGASGNAAEWNADGDAVDSGRALGDASEKGVTGADANAVTGTAGTSGNVPEWNADGDIIDSGKASSDIGSGSGVDAEDDGTVVVSNATAINFSTNLSVSDDTDGTVTVTASGSGGSAVILDLGDDGTNESSDLQEIATTGDQGSTITEPAADKMLIDLSTLVYTVLPGTPGGDSVNVRPTTDGTGATGFGAIAVGLGSSCGGGSSAAIGRDSTSDGGESLAVGRSATTSTNSSATALGVRASAAGDNATAVGDSTDANSGSAVAIGDNSQANQTEATAVGSFTDVTAARGTALGHGAQAGHLDSVALGSDAATDAADQVHVGGKSVAGVDFLDLTERSSDPADPAEGRAVMWRSDGTGSGSDGDVLIKSTAGGVTTTTNLTTSSGGAFPVDPENATDSGTDAYVSETTTSTPNSGEVIVRDFQSANTTTTPTLDGVSLVARDGSALWAGALNRSHYLLYDGTDYRVLDVAPIDEDDMASDSPSAVPTQQSVKAYSDATLQPPGMSTDPGLAFDTWRTPNANRPTFLTIAAEAQTDGTSIGNVFLSVDESGGTSRDYFLRLGYADNDLPSGSFSKGSASTIIPAGGSYQIVNSSDPNSNNDIQHIREFTL